MSAKRKPPRASPIDLHHTAHVMMGKLLKSAGLEASGLDTEEEMFGDGEFAVVPMKIPEDGVIDVDALGERLRGVAMPPSVAALRLHMPEEVRGVPRGRPLPRSCTLFDTWADHYGGMNILHRYLRTDEHGERWFEVSWVGRNGRRVAVPEHAISVTGSTWLGNDGDGNVTADPRDYTP